MNLSISNIAWSAEYDNAMYHYLKISGYKGLEIAPTRIFPSDPYSHISEARDWADRLKEEYGLVISSMQSIWYGRTERVFGDDSDRRALIEYSRKACEFASAIGCSNLVFGSPRNRDTDNMEHDYPIAIDFFRKLSDVAQDYGTVVAMEPNPTIYKTRFVNTTLEAIELIEKVNSDGFKLNFDLGTVIYNDEDLHCLSEFPEYVHHIHISEPYLSLIDKNHKHLHRALLSFGREHQNVFISIEMGMQNELANVQNTINYLKELTDEIH